MDIDLLQASIQSTSKQQLAADHLTPAVVEIDLRERVEQLEEALEDNSGRLDEILKLLKGKDKYECSSSEDDGEKNRNCDQEPKQGSHAPQPPL